MEQEYDSKRGQASRNSCGVQLRSLCKMLRSTFASIENNVQFKKRLLVVASESNKLIEIDPVTEDILSWRPVWKAPTRRVKSKECWPTSIALCPYNGDFYVCQYAVSMSCSQDTGDYKLQSTTWQQNYFATRTVTRVRGVLRVAPYKSQVLAGEVCAPLQWRQPGVCPRCRRASH